MDKPNVYTLPGGIPFLPALADGLKSRLGTRLQDALILLPTRRAIRELGQYLIGDAGTGLLPRMRPLADIDPDEPPFEPGYLTGLVDPLMPGAQRRFALSTLMAHFHENTTGESLDPAARLALTDPLLAILDDAAMEEVSFSAADALDAIKGRAAKHFQDALKLYEILQQSWPHYLAEQGLMEPMARRVALLNALTRLWQEQPPDHPVIIAGSTGTLKATAKLIRCVAHMPEGFVILPGLDKRTKDVTWRNIQDDHPQKSLDNLIRTIGVERGDVADWLPTGRDTGHDARIRLISESLVPVEDTADWPARIETLRDHYTGDDFFRDALQGLSLLEARTDEDEAMAIAMAMRDVLETPKKTAALITPDAALARRVKARLRRWAVDVDYSQGEPLEETHIGEFFTAILNLVEDMESPLHLATLLNHPLCTLGLAQGETAQAWRVLEKAHFRGLRPALDVYQDSELIRSLMNCLEPVVTQANGDPVDARRWSETLVTAAEVLAATDDLSGRARLWVEDAGEKAAGMLEELIRFGSELGEMNLPEFARLISKLMRGRVVRPRYGTHPRLQILGPLEARMLSADVIILGGLNEGVWPAAPPKLPFLSRDMRKALGLSLPERRFGLAAHDFSMLAAHPRVILTRAERSDDGPTVASRWIWRLKTLLSGALGEKEMEARLSADTPYLQWAQAVDAVDADQVEPSVPPNPKPPFDARWPKGRKLSITKITQWIRDPYSIYARYILDLEPLKPLDAKPGPAERGNAIHKAVENFTREFRDRLAPNAVQALSQRLAEQLIAYGYDGAELAREKVRLDRLAGELVDHMQSSRESGVRVTGIEAYGAMLMPDINFTLTGKADLIEQSGDAYQVTDYKTGSTPTAKVVAAGFDPQLPLTANMIAAGAFKHIRPGETEKLQYVKLSGTGKGVEVKAVHGTGRDAKSVDDLRDLAGTTIRELVSAFDKPETPYPCQPRIQFTFDYSDYDDLARRGEWAQVGDDRTEAGS